MAIETYEQEESLHLADITMSTSFQETHGEDSSLISRIYQLTSNLDIAYQRQITDGDITVEFLNAKPGKVHYIVTISGIRYFLKEVSEIDNKSQEGGVEEYEDTLEASHILANTPKVSVITSSFAFHDTVHHKKYNATAWTVAAEKPLSRILAEHQSPTASIILTEEKVQDLQRRAIYIISTLSDFKDVTTDNMGYDQTTDTLVVFDINKERGNVLRSCPDDEL